MKRKLLWASAGVCAVLLLLLLTTLERPAAPPVPERAPEFELGITTAREVHDLVQGYGDRLQGTESRIDALDGRIGTLNEHVERALGELTRLIRETPKETSPRLSSESAPDFAARFRAIDFGAPAPDPHEVHVPAGSFGRATLLTGVFAPVHAEPLPVLLRLDEALSGPSGSRVPIAQALLVGKAQGDANAQRATIQLHALSFVGRSGMTVEVPVNGWVIDEDGVQGLSGRYVWRGEELAALAGAAGGLSAAAESLASPRGVLGGNPLDSAGPRAGSGALSRLSDILATRMEEITPAVYVPNGGSVTVAFVSGVTLSALVPGETSCESDRVPYAGLDLDR